MTDLEFELMRDGPVTKYFRAPILEEHLAALVGLGYRVDRFECARWVDAEVVHDDLARVLAFPDYYGRNLDALVDCMRDLEVSEAGRVIVLSRYDVPVAAIPRVANVVLDIIAGQSWAELLFGRRLIALVQSEDPWLELEPVGAHPARWNHREWMNASRGV